MQVLEIEEIEALAEFTSLNRPLGPLLSRHDIELVGVALEPSDTAMLILIETRWAESLSLAARRVGGRIVGGERVTRSRVAAALAQLTIDEPPVDPTAADAEPD
jgi:hypothetical protein